MAHMVSSGCRNCGRRPAAFLELALNGVNLLPRPGSLLKNSTDNDGRPVMRIAVDMAVVKPSWLRSVL